MAVLAASIGCARPGETQFLNFDPESTPRSRLESGWSYFETNAATDTYVWCEGTRAILLIDSRADGDRLVRFRGWPFRWKDAPPQTLVVRLNDRTVARFAVPEAFAVSSFIVPQDSWKKGSNRLEFEFAAAAAPKDKIPPAQDARTLSYAFDWLEIEPIKPTAAP